MEGLSDRAAPPAATRSEYYQDILPLLGSRQAGLSHYSLFDVPLAVLLPASKFISVSRRIQHSDFERGGYCLGGTGHVANGGLVVERYVDPPQNARSFAVFPGPSPFYNWLEAQYKLWVVVICNEYYKGFSTRTRIAGSHAQPVDKNTRLSEARDMHIRMGYQSPERTRLYEICEP
ncbi:hypothetical protein ARMSODRAFT_974688 [Armillaria solidipes]|uniref:Uncharacterized protein n=1 Tax=Armillaria solidipes TaxID=1076256 RepID=A0A2H3BKL5_9AGAR|nr:hypothetical protein ARMSODRAFT_974688 [Armillaria solidipes]